MYNHMYILELLKKKHKYLKENNKMLLASVCNDLALLYLRDGKYIQSIEESKVVQIRTHFALILLKFNFSQIEAKIYKDSNEHIKYAQVNRMIGEVYFTMNEFETALSFQQIHLGITNSYKYPTHYFIKLHFYSGG